MIIHEPKVVTAEKLDNGVIVAFADGRTALYPAVLLYSAIELAEVMLEHQLEQENG